jgi:hypothetical protein
MTLLRKQLESARREYETVRYGGDLVREVLSPPLRLRGGYVLGVILTGAIAASTFLGAMLPHQLLMPATSHPRMPLAREFQFPQKMPFAMPSIPALPRMAPHMSLREMAPSLVPPGGWHLPSLEDFHLPALFDNSGHA